MDVAARLIYDVRIRTVQESRLVFDIQIVRQCETDPGSKNFWMVHDNEQGWRLSPAFDLIPDVGRKGEHVLFFDLGANYPGRADLETLGRRWGIRNAESVVAQAFEAMAGWREAFANSGVEKEDAIRFKEIGSHLQE
ncbi:MAG: hypothetical protein WCS01_08555 [bacterium]